MNLFSQIALTNLCADMFWSLEVMTASALLCDGQEINALLYADGF